jgi:DNA-binding NarL/FixJ family response regulator
MTEPFAMSPYVPATRALRRASDALDPRATLAPAPINQDANRAEARLRVVDRSAPSARQPVAADDALLLSDIGLAVEGLRHLLQRETAIGTVTIARDLAELHETLRRRAPRLLVIGAECLPADPVAMLDALHRLAPATRQVVLASRARCAGLAGVVEFGVDGVLLYEASGESLGQALREVLEGRPQVDPVVQLQIVRDLGRAATPAPALTRREMDVLLRVARGQPNKAIGRELGLTEGTVKTYLRRLRARLGARDRTHAVILAAALGLVPIERC